VTAEITLACVLGSGALAVALTRLVRDVARRHHLLDRPNERSAHAVATPRLGGIGIMVPFLVVSACLRAWSGGEAGVVIPCTCVIALLGLVDDLRPLSARWRFAVQTVAAAVVVLWSGRSGAAALAPFDALLPYPMLAAGAILWIVWVTNLYNFMDGIDGLAGGQTVVAALGLAWAARSLGAPALATELLVLAASAAGFLRYNLPKASIFMGDVGSTAIGFYLASMPFAPGTAPMPLRAVALALSLFVLDATSTLVRRMWRGERWFAAHRSHLYQRPLAHGVSHAHITYPAYIGMAVTGTLAAILPGVAPAVQVALFAVPLTLFVAAWGVVRRLERRGELR
jgi:Fuc2NAc and GlcNAc transferase